MQGLLWNIFILIQRAYFYLTINTNAPVGPFLIIFPTFQALCPHYSSWTALRQKPLVLQSPVLVFFFFLLRVIQSLFLSNFAQVQAKIRQKPTHWLTFSLVNIMARKQHTKKKTSNRSIFAFHAQGYTTELCTSINKRQILQMLYNNTVGISISLTFQMSLFVSLCTPNTGKHQR